MGRSSAIKQGMLTWRLKESNTDEQMHNLEKNKLKLILECINRQTVCIVNMALFNATKKGSPNYFLDQNHYGI